MVSQKLNYKELIEATKGKRIYVYINSSDIDRVHAPVLVTKAALMRGLNLSNKKGCSLDFIVAETAAGIFIIEVQHD